MQALGDASVQVSIEYFSNMTSLDDSLYSVSSLLVYSWCVGPCQRDRRFHLTGLSSLYLNFLSFWWTYVSLISSVGSYVVCAAQLKCTGWNTYENSIENSVKKLLQMCGFFFFFKRKVVSSVGSRSCTKKEGRPCLVLLRFKHCYQSEKNKKGRIPSCMYFVVVWDEDKAQKLL